jgi:hypothetical protein
LTTARRWRDPLIQAVTARAGEPFVVRILLLLGVEFPARHDAPDVVTVAYQNEQTASSGHTPGERHMADHELPGCSESRSAGGWY